MNAGRAAARPLAWLRQPSYASWLLTFTSLLLSACAQLPEGLRQTVENMPLEFEQHSLKLQQAKAEFTAMTAQPEWVVLSPYAEREQWGDAGKQGDTLYKDAKTLFESTAKPLYEVNEPRDAATLRQAIAQTRELLASSLATAKQPRLRGAFLLNAKKQAPSIHAKAVAELDQLNAISEKLQLRLSELIKTYPDKHADLSARDNKGKDKQQAAKKYFAALDSEFNTFAEGQADYAVLADSALMLTAILQDAEKYAAQTHSKVAELDRTLVRILSDQKIDYYATVGRASWCEHDGCRAGDSYTYPAVKVTEAVREGLDNFSGENMAELRSSFYSAPKLSLRVQSNLWQALRVQPTQHMNRSHGYADYWLERTSSRAYQRYTDVVDGQENLGPWTEVSEDAFWKQQEHLGMALLSKPVGFYVEESQTDPEPAGAALVATPTMLNGEPTGRNQYGYWGGGFWHYYGQYRFFSAILGGGRYGYNDWNHYGSRSRGSAYYGRNNQWGTYGSNTYKDERYAKSDYAKRNPRDIAEARSPGAGQSKRSADSSIRGAGGAARNKGPGGRGKS